MFGVRDGVVGCGGGEEVRGDDFGTLVNELVEGVLAVCSRCTPDYRLMIGGVYVCVCMCVHKGTRGGSQCQKRSNERRQLGRGTTHLPRSDNSPDHHS